VEVYCENRRNDKEINQFLPVFSVELFHFVTYSPDVFRFKRSRFKLKLGQKFHRTGGKQMQITRIVGAASTGLVALVAAQPAFGFAAPVNYYSAGSTLKAWQDGVVQAEMYGKFSVENASYLRNDTHVRDPRPGGDKVFERTQYYYWIFSSSAGTKDWVWTGTDQGPKTDSSTWQIQYDHDTFNPEADKGRMRTQVCEDHGIAPDPCSGWPQFTTDL
jgi:hypothetical protein